MTDLSKIRNFSITGPRGPIPLRLYRPEQAAAGSPLVVYYHGGGWVLGDLGSGDAMLRHLANRTGVCFLSVEYRLAPEHKFPAGLEDALCAFDYAVAHASELGCDPALVGVAGESAGGNIAAVLSQITARRASTTLTTNRSSRTSAMSALIAARPLTRAPRKRGCARSV